MASLKLRDKLNARFAEDVTVTEFSNLLNAALSEAAFSSRKELSNYLMEGVSLNINKVSAKALSVPCGEYMVWVTDPNHTSLVPVRAADQEVFESKWAPYEVFTHNLLNNWNTLEKTLTERFGGESSNEGNKEGPEEPFGGAGDDENMQGQPEDSEGEKETPKGSPITSKINMSTVERTPIVRAMQQRGHTVTSLANAVGVDPPAISRILRTPKSTQGDPGGRNPSLPLAARIAGELKMDAEALFPDIFGIPTQDFKARQTPGNRGSGMKGAAKGSRKKGKASKLFTKGNHE